MKPRPSRSEGVRRLSLVIGSLVASAFLVYSCNEDGFSTFARDIHIYLLFSLALFALGWAAVQIAAWVWRGFLADRRPPDDSPPLP